MDKLKDLKLGASTRQVEMMEVEDGWFSAIQPDAQRSPNLYISSRNW